MAKGVGMDIYGPQGEVAKVAGNGEGIASRRWPEQMTRSRSTTTIAGITIGYSIGLLRYEDQATTPRPISGVSFSIRIRRDGVADDDEWATPGNRYNEMHSSTRATEWFGESARPSRRGQRGASSSWPAGLAVA